MARRQRPKIAGVTVYKRGSTWSYRLDLGAELVTGERERENKGGFDSEDAAWKAALESQARLEQGRHVKPSHRKVPVPRRVADRCQGRCEAEHLSELRRLHRGLRQTHDRETAPPGHTKIPSITANDGPVGRRAADRRAGTLAGAAIPLGPMRPPGEPSGCHLPLPPLAVRLNDLQVGLVDRVLSAGGRDRELSADGLGHPRVRDV